MSTESVRAHVKVNIFIFIFISIFLLNLPQGFLFLCISIIYPLKANLQYPNETQARISATHSGLWWPPAPSPWPVVEAGDDRDTIIRLPHF